MACAGTVAGAGTWRAVAGNAGSPIWRMAALLGRADRRVLNTDLGKKTFFGRFSSTASQVFLWWRAAHGSRDEMPDVAKMIGILG
jgi:hypothetical protein